MKKLQEKKYKSGITLIALAITVVVLIILAGVSINAVVGDDGIIKKAQESANLTKESEAKEIINRAIIEFIATDEYDTLEDFLKTKVSAGTIDSVINNGDGTLNVSKNGYTVTVENKTNSANGNGGNTGGETQKPEITVNGIKVVADSQGAGATLGEASTYLGNTLYITFTHSITGGTTTVKPDIPYAVTKNGTYTFTVTGSVNGKSYTKEVSVTVNQFKKLTLEDINIQIGDSVNYTYDTADNYLLLSTYSGYSSNQTIAQDTTLTWKVLNVDKENDTVDIISTEPISSTVYFSDILGYSNGPYLMNEICKAHYSNTTLGLNARSINLLDMEKHLTEQGIVKRNGNSAGNGYGETMTYTSFANTFFNYYPKLYANQIGGGINTTSIVKPDITKGNDPYKESEALATTEPTTDNSYEQAENGLTVTHTAYSITINDENYGEAGEVMKSENDFWVAARYVYADGDFAGFGLRTANTAVNMRPDNGLMFYSNISTDSDGYALRPVVSLSSNLLTGEKTNDAWDLSK